MFSHSLHMHANGRKAETRQYRNDSNGNEVLVDSAKVEYYSFEQAGVHLITYNESVTIEVRVWTERGTKFDTESSGMHRCVLDARYATYPLRNHKVI